MRKRLFALLLIPLLLVTPTYAAPQEPALRLPIVMYHHISKEPSRWNDYVISLSEFESDLSWLRSHGYETVSLRELLAWTEGAFIMPEKPCMITFDDGFESTAAYAEPLLERFGFCGVVAVIGSACERFSALDEHDPELSNLSWADARELAERGTIEVQCHTWELHSLWPRSGCRKKQGESEAQYRYLLSMDLARYLVGCRENGVAAVPGIAYPYGAYSPETAAAVRDFGFRAAFTCTEKINLLTGAGEELYHLGRYNRPHGSNSEEFFSKWEENS